MTAGLAGEELDQRAVYQAGDDRGEDDEVAT